jgi:hypothetical protein
MKSTRRPRLSVEPLESRFCPVASISLEAGTLFIRGAVTPNSPTGLRVTETANNLVTITDNGHFLGTYRTSNIYMQLTSHIGSPIVVDLGGHSLTGNLYINLGIGDTTDNPVSGVFIDNGTIGGTVTIVGGSGDETVQPGSNSFVAGVGPTSDGPLSIGGDLIFDPKMSNIAGLFNTLDTGTPYDNDSITAPVVTIGGNLISAGGMAIGISSNTTIGGNLSVTPSAANGSGFGALQDEGTIDGSLSYTGNPNSPGDVILLQQENGGTAFVGQNVTINTGSGANGVQLAAGTQVGGNVSITEVNGDVALQGTINQNATVQGTNSLNFAFNGEIDGALNVTAGNGGSSQTTSNFFSATGFTGTVFGNANFTLGNGPNGTWTIGDGTAGDGAIGGTLNWHSGNSETQLALTSPNYYNLNVHFGNDNDTFTLAGATISGLVDGGGREPGGANIFNMTSGTILPNFQLINFP